MPIVYDPSSYLVSLIWDSPNFSSGGGATVLGFNGPASTIGTIEDLANAVGDAWIAHLRPRTDSSYTLASCRVEGDSESFEEPLGVAGAADVEGPPSNCAVLRYKKGQLKGPRQQGRNFWPGMMSEGDVNERGALSSGAQDALSTAFDAFFTYILEYPAGPFEESIPQAVTPESLTPPFLPWPKVLSSGIRPVIGTQRRRIRT